jgi:hypothetical protein
MSGVRDDLSAVSDAEMLKLVQKILKENGDARVLILFISCYSVTDKEFDQLLSLVKSNKQAVILVRTLLNFDQGNQVKRVRDPISEKQKNDY